MATYTTTGDYSVIGEQSVQSICESDEWMPPEAIVRIASTHVHVHVGGGIILTHNNIHVHVHVCIQGNSIIKTMSISNHETAREVQHVIP